MLDPRVVFVTNPNGPERLVAEAEVHFGPDAGPLAGLKLVGFSLWRDPEGDLYITFPARAFGTMSERRYFDYLRSAEGTGDAPRRCKEWMIAEYRAQNPPGSHDQAQTWARRPHR